MYLGKKIEEVVVEDGNLIAVPLLFNSEEEWREVLGWSKESMKYRSTIFRYPSGEIIFLIHLDEGLPLGTEGVKEFVKAVQNLFGNSRHYTGLYSKELAGKKEEPVSSYPLYNKSFFRNKGAAVIRQGGRLPKCLLEKKFMIPKGRR